MTMKEVKRLRREIERVKRQLMGLDGFRPGSLSQQYNVCGKPGCRCKASPPQRHGPYHQLSYTRKGRSGTKFVRRAQMKRIRRELKNYEKFRQLVERWIDLQIEISELTTAQELEKKQ